MLLRIYMGSFPCGQVGWLLHLNVDCKGFPARWIVLHLSCSCELLCSSSAHSTFLIVFVWHWFSVMRIFKSAIHSFFFLQCVTSVRFTPFHLIARVLLMNAYCIFLQQHTNRQWKPFCNIACSCFLFTIGLWVNEGAPYWKPGSLAIVVKYQ